MAHKIAFFIPSLRGGGAERVMLDLATGFSDRGVDVDLVLAKAEGAYLSEVPPNVRIVDLGASRVLASLPRLIQYLREKRPAAMLSTQVNANLVALWAKRLSGVTTRVVIREATTGSHPVYRNRAPVLFHVMSCLARRFYPSASGIVAVSEGVLEDMVSSLGLPRERIRVIYNPVVNPRLFEMGEKPVNHPWFSFSEKPIVLGVGRLAKEKDYPTLIRAFARICREQPARLVILGEGEERAHLTSLVRELGLDDDVDMPGFVDNPFAYMSRASVFVLSSVCEGLPNALIQAAALGTPVVSTDCPSGPNEILQGGLFGRLVPTGNELALANAVLETMAKIPKPDIHKEFLERFSEDSIIEAYASILLGGSYA